MLIYLYISDSIMYIDSYYGSEVNRRLFFNNFAKIKGFDPLIAQNWYSVTSEELTSHKVLIFIFNYTNFNFYKFVILGSNCGA